MTEPEQDAREIAELAKAHAKQIRRLAPAIGRDHFGSFIAKRVSVRSLIEAELLRGFDAPGAPAGHFAYELTPLGRAVASHLERKPSP